MAGNEDFMPDPRQRFTALAALCLSVPVCIIGLLMNVNYNSLRRQLFFPTRLLGRLLDLRRPISC
jgi:hypothetical protein